MMQTNFFMQEQIKQDLATIRKALIKLSKYDPDLSEQAQTCLVFIELKVTK